MQAKAAIVTLSLFGCRPQPASHESREFLLGACPLDTIQRPNQHTHHGVTRPGLFSQTIERLAASSGGEFLFLATTGHSLNPIVSPHPGPSFLVDVHKNRPGSTNAGSSTTALRPPPLLPSATTTYLQCNTAAGPLTSTARLRCRCEPLRRRRRTVRALGMLGPAD